MVHGSSFGSGQDGERSATAGQADSLQASRLSQMRLKPLPKSGDGTQKRRRRRRRQTGEQGEGRERETGDGSSEVEGVSSEGRGTAAESPGRRHIIFTPSRQYLAEEDNEASAASPMLVPSSTLERDAPPKMPGEDGGVGVGGGGGGGGGGAVSSSPSKNSAHGPLGHGADNSPPYPPHRPQQSPVGSKTAAQSQDDGSTATNLNDGRRRSLDSPMLPGGRYAKDDEGGGHAAAHVSRVWTQRGDKGREEIARSGRMSMWVADAKIPRSSSGLEGMGSEPSRAPGKLTYAKSVGKLVSPTHRSGL